MTRSAKKNLKTFSEINITPFVDIMLVLLIIFMITSPMLVSNINVDLPKATAGKLDNSSEHIAIIIDDSNNLYIKNKKIKNKEDLLGQINFWSQGNKDIKIHIKGDHKVNYGKIMETVSLIGKNGYSKISLVALNIK